MYPPGHVTVAYLVGRHRMRGRASTLASLGPVVFGALLPDLIDKTIYVLRVSPHGRTLGHAFWVWGVLTLLAMMVREHGSRRSFALAGVVLGGLSHLVADLVDDAVDGFTTSGFAWSTWGFWPWMDADGWYLRVPHLLPRTNGMVTILEVITVLGTCAWLALAHRR